MRQLGAMLTHRAMMALILHFVQRDDLQSSRKHATSYHADASACVMVSPLRFST